MIIKILGVKNKSHGAVGRVLNYIREDKGRINISDGQSMYHNLMYTKLDLVAKEFEDNYQNFANVRSNGNICIHVVISHSPLNNDKLTQEMMDEIVQEFLQHNYPDTLAYANHHYSEQNLHSHILIGANNIRSNDSTRLSKTQLRDMHEHMREFVHERYPELNEGI